MVAVFCSIRVNLVFAATTISTDISTNGNLYIDGNVGIATASPSQKLDVKGIAQASSFRFSGNANTWELNGRGTDVATWGAPYFRSLISDSVTALDIMPNGNPTGGQANTGNAWIDVCNSDLSSLNSHNFECLVLSAMPDTYRVGSHYGGTGSNRPLRLGGSSVYIKADAYSGTTYAMFSNLGTYISPVGTDRVWFTDGDIRLGSGVDLRWNSGATPYAVALDAGIARNAAGVIEVNTGTAGTYGDLRIRSINPTTGDVGIGTTSPGEKLEVNGGIKLNTATAKPTCDSTHRGTQWFVQGVAGVKDTFEVCAKDAGDAYAWRTLY